MGEIISLIATAAFALANVFTRKAAMNSPTSTSLHGAILSTVITLALGGAIYAIAVFARETIAMNMKGLLCFAAAGVLSVYLGRTFLYLSIEHLGSIVGAVLKNLAPFFTVFIAALFMGEAITFSVIVGGGFIFLGLFLVSGKNKSASSTGNVRGLRRLKSWIPSDKKRIFSAANIGIVYGIISALTYAAGNSLRISGMMALPDPFLGAVVGSIAGLFIFSVFSMFNNHYRNAATATIKEFNIWLFLAGISISIGQILFLISLMYTGVARATLIISVQTIFTLFLSNWIFKTNEKISIYTILAIILVMIGAGTIIAY